MKKYEITTTAMRKIIVSANSSEEAIRIASGQFKGERESVMMISSKEQLET